MARWLKLSLFCLANGVVGAIILLSPLGLEFERVAGLSNMFKIRGSSEMPAQVAVIAINGQTGQDLGLAPLPRDWPRSIHGTLIDRLTELGAAAIIFDIHFGKEKAKEPDSVLVEATRNSNRVIVVERLTGKMQPLRDKSGETTGVIWIESALPPFRALAEAAKGVGTFTLPKNDSSVSDFITFKQSADNKPTLPSLALQFSSEPVEEKWNNYLRALGVPEDLLVPSSSVLSDGHQLGNRMAQLKQFIDERPAIASKSDDFLEGDTTSALDAKLLTALKGLYFGPSARYLNFYGPPGSILNIPYQNVIDPSTGVGGSVLESIQGSVVFVGYSDLYDPGQLDRFHTIYTNKYGVDLAGVEIVATSFANLLNNEEVKPLDITASALLVLLWGIFFTAVFSLAPATRSVPVVILLLLGYGFMCQYLFRTNNLWLPTATPILIQAPLAFAIGIMGQYLFERRRGAQFSDAIRQYVPDSVVNDLVQGGFDPSEANKVVYSVCLATDMAGFSSIAEGLAPGELASFLNDYFDAMAAPLHENGVDVTEFRADAIMCAWTGLEHDADVRLKPIKAALDSRQAIERFKLTNPLLQSGGLRVGLEAGEVYVGHAGGGGQFAYSIVGDAANTASRLEGLNKHLGTTIITSSEVVKGLEDGLALRHMGEFQLKGKADALSVVEIISEKGNASAANWELIELFGNGLERFNLGDWQSAKSIFEELGRAFPDDLAAKLYADLCGSYMTASHLPEFPNIVVMDSK